MSKEGEFLRTSARALSRSASRMSGPGQALSSGDSVRTNLPFADVWINAWSSHELSINALVDVDLKTMWVSSYPRDLLPVDGALYFDQRQLKARAPEDQCRLESMSRSAVADNQALSATFESPSASLAVSIAPAEGMDSPVLAVKISPAVAPASRLPDFTVLYGLTPAENKVINQMILGESINEIAIEWGKSPLTIRTHIKRIYSKMGINSKEQLFSLILKSTS